jgi:hypothetical protein
MNNNMRFQPKDQHNFNLESASAHAFKQSYCCDLNNIRLSEISIKSLIKRNLSRLFELGTIIHVGEFK